MIKDTFGYSALTADLMLDEGRRAFPYPDSLGNLTIGIGRNLTGKGLSGTEIDYLFANDITECCTIMDAHIPWWRGLPPDKQRVLLNLCFNVGWGSLSMFKKFLAAMQTHDFHVAASELKDSVWYRQVGLRGPRVIARLLANTLPGEVVAT